MSCEFPDVTAEYQTTPPLKEAYEIPSGRCFRGTREALVATGLFRAAWFPGEPGMRRHTSRLMHEGREISISRRKSPHVFDAFVGFTAEERASREQTHEAKRRLEALHEDLAALPADADAYRRLVAGAELRVSAVVKSLAQGEARTGGYRYADEARARIAQCLAALMREILFGPVELDPAKRESARRAIYAHHGEELPADNGFAQFLARVSTPLADPDEHEGPTT